MTLTGASQTIVALPESGASAAALVSGSASVKAVAPVAVAASAALAGVGAAGDDDELKIRNGSKSWPSTSMTFGHKRELAGLFQLSILRIEHSPRLLQNKNRS